MQVSHFRVKNYAYTYYKPYQIFPSFFFLNGIQNWYIENYQQAMNLSPKALMATKNPKCCLQSALLIPFVSPNWELIKANLGDRALVFDCQY